MVRVSALRLVVGAVASGRGCLPLWGSWRGVALRFHCFSVEEVMLAYLSSAQALLWYAFGGLRVLAFAADGAGDELFA